MNTISIIIFAIFGVWSLVHLVFCFLEKEKLRKLTKPFCLVLLGIGAAVAAPQYPLIYIGAFLGSIGDIFLINKKNLISFLVGALIFIIGHGCYFAQILVHLNALCGFQFPWWSYLVLFGSLVAIMFALYPFNKKLAGIATLAGNFYIPFLFVLLALSIFFGIKLDQTGQSSLPGTLIAVGYGMFIISDITLILTTFVKDIRRRDFPIMLTYLLGEFGIVFGLILAII